MKCGDDMLRGHVGCQSEQIAGSRCDARWDRFDYGEYRHQPMHRTSRNLVGAPPGTRVGGWAGVCKDMLAGRLTPDVRILAVASPDYPGRHRARKTPADLRRHVCINWRSPAVETFADGSWRRKERGSC